MEKTPTLKTMSTLLMVFPEYRLHNALNFGWGFPLLATLKGCKRGYLFMGMTPMLRHCQIFHCGSLCMELPMLAILNGGFPLPATPKW